MSVVNPFNLTLEHENARLALIAVYDDLRAVIDDPDTTAEDRRIARQLLDRILDPYDADQWAPFAKAALRRAS